VQRFEVYRPRTPQDGAADAFERVAAWVVLSPDEMNRYLRYVLAAPAAESGGAYPTRVPCRIEGRRLQVFVDRITTVNKTRLGARLGRLHPATQRKILQVLAELFAP